MAKAFLDLHRLRCFEAAARLGSMSAAAREIGMAQPALSLHIAKLEGYYQVRLLDRLPRGVAPTRTGDALLSHARTILGELAAADAALRRMSREMSIPRELNIGLVSSLAETVTPRLIVLLASKFPAITPRFKMLTAAQCHRHLEASMVDVALTVRMREFPEGEVIHTSALCLVSRPGAEDLPPRVRLADLAGRRLIIPPAGNGLREVIDLAAREASVELTNILELNGLGPRKSAVEAGLGSTILPVLNIANELRMGQFVKRDIFEPRLLRTVVLRHRDGLDPRFVSRLRTLIQESIIQSEQIAGAPVLTSFPASPG
ncbi:MAG: hypothetical protein DI556_22250 [Rhodovulum sulfidophilum]|uniref:HTH lysR-type domain-containing protein n=1 Tax=Rhodovulum sulfidophilum TaxID=35806 RepID=A0A2W5MWP6_RHOSU|nr:MAG: hypothetical protein DI556_22250 [Rhodovulum sulfidophilum]